MYFKYPSGTDQISVEGQNFKVDAKDEHGNQYFRAPDVLAATILGLPGFSRAEPPEGAPEDLPPSDPKRAEAVDKLSAEIEALREENQRLRQELGAARRERDELQTRLDDLEAEIVRAGVDKAEEVLRLTPGAAAASQPTLSKENPRAGTPTPGPAANKPSGR